MHFFEHTLEFLGICDRKINSSFDLRAWDLGYKKTISICNTIAREISLLADNENFHDLWTYKKWKASYYPSTTTTMWQKFLEYL